MSQKFSFKSFLSSTKIDFMGVHRVAFLLSVFLIIASIALIIFRGLNLGIDFSGGILVETRFQEEVKASDLRKILDKQNFGDVSLQNFGDKNFMIKVSGSSDSSKNQTIQQIKKILNKNFDKVEYRKIDFVGPQIGKELVTKGVVALLLSLVFIMIYIWSRFDWHFGVGSIVALFHDTILIFGVFSLTGLEFNSTSIAAILAIIGYSINDSVVIYDRIRENLRKFKQMNIFDLLNLSINATLSRTILTSCTTLLALLSLVIFGGQALQSFSISTFVGIIIGTYSSVYIAAPILLYINPRKKKLEERKN
jgi:preprotein translocase SecF subunit